jgi:UDP-2,4-diacetamido-2,4,6-trideoxy-beta-L-altropyranose hydrolase
MQRSGGDGPVVLVRADGSRAIGHGHIFRTLVLADALAERGARAVFLCRDLDGAPLARVERSPHPLLLLDADLPEEAEPEVVLARARDHAAGHLVVDRYASTPDFYRTVRAEGLRTLAIDDICEHAFPVDVLVNQNIGAEALAYEVAPETRLLLGPRYAMVAARYRGARPAAAPRRDRVERLLVSFGGTDPDDATGRVLDALEVVDTHPLEVDVIVGAASRHAEATARRAGASRHRVRVHRDLSDLVAAMQSADAFVGAGGSTTWEACCLGLPMALLPIADNQLGIVRELARRGIALDLGEARAAERTRLGATLAAWIDGAAGRLSAQAEAAWKLVDGRGAERVASALLDRQA